MTASSNDNLRDRILKAAIDEFSSVGFAGARVDRIARNAGGNKQLIYHYFGGKRKLYDEVIRQLLKETGADIHEQRYRDPSEIYRKAAERRAHDEHWFILLGWEGVTERGIEISDLPEREETFNLLTNIIKSRQSENAIDPSIDPQMVTLMLAFSLWAPVLLPQIIRAVTGDSYHDNLWQQRWDGFVLDLFDRLAPQPNQ